MHIAWTIAGHIRGGCPVESARVVMGMQYSIRSMVWNLQCNSSSMVCSSSSICSSGNMDCCKSGCLLKANERLN